MVRDANHSLFTFITNKVDLILDVEHSRVIFLAGGVPDLALYRPRVSFLSIFTHICESYPLFPIPVHGYGPLPIRLPPSLSTTMQAIGSIVGVQGICFAVEIMYSCVFDAIGGPANGLAKVGGVVRLVELGFGETKDYVVTMDIEFLNGSPVSEEGEG